MEGRVCGIGGAVFSSLSLSIKGSDVGQRYESGETVGQKQHEKKVEAGVSDQEKENVIGVNGSGAMNMTKHLWAGAVAAMVSRSSLFNLSAIIHLEHLR